MLNYTTWITENLPDMRGASTAYTAALVKRVKEACWAWTLSFRVTLLGLTVLIADFAHGLLGMPAFKEPASWWMFGIAAALGIVLGFVAEFLIVTNRIRKVVSSSSLSDLTN